jgi:hypothetical protein
MDTIPGGIYLVNGQYQNAHGEVLKYTKKLADESKRVTGKTWAPPLAQAEVVEPEPAPELESEPEPEAEPEV